MSNNVEQMEEAEKRARVHERNHLVRQLSPVEYQHYRKNRWKIFKESFFEQLGCGCVFGFLFGLVVAAVVLFDRKEPWSTVLVLFGLTWLVSPIFYAIYSVWDARVQNEIAFLNKIFKRRPATKQIAIAQFHDELKQILAIKSKSNTHQSAMESVFISKD